MMKLCVDQGGSITGEHGVGMEKQEIMPLLFSDDDLETMTRVKRVFNPDERLNPAKMLPLTKSCGEIRVKPMPQQSARS
jgi:glycolate oxidase